MPGGSSAWDANSAVGLTANAAQHRFVDDMPVGPEERGQAAR